MENYKYDYQYLCQFESFELRDLQVLQNALKCSRPFLGLIEFLEEKYPPFQYPEIHQLLKDLTQVCILRHKRGPI